MNYEKKQLTYKEFLQMDLSEPMPVLYEIFWEGVKYEILVNRVADCRYAGVFGTGAITKEVELPVFSRASWRNEMPFTGIWYFDPTVYLGSLMLGWGYGTKERWYLQEIGQLVQHILAVLGIPASQTLFYGSSGGGFTSIMLAAMLKGRATAVNPQLYVPDYWSGHIEALKRVATEPGGELIQERVDAAEYIARCGYMPRIHLIINTASANDMNKQVPAFLSRLAQKQIDCTDRLFIDYYTDQGGHSAMPEKEVCIRTIKEDLLPGDTRVEDAEARALEAERKFAELRKKNNELAAKYKVLAQSVLGRITLFFWKMKKLLWDVVR